MRLFLLSILTLALALPAVAAPGKKELVSQPLIDELAARGPLPEKALKVMRPVERCLRDDKTWERGLGNELTANQLYELMASAVTCWQTTEKRLTKAGPDYAAVLPFVVARARYVEAFRDYLWGVDARLSSKDPSQVCRRFKTALASATTANDVARGLADSFGADTAKALAAGQDKLAADLGGYIAKEYEDQRCE